MTNGKPHDSSLQAIHRRRIEMIRDEAINLAGTATKIAQAMTQILERGGAINIQAQMSFITGAHARISKDWGVAEHLQAQGSTIKPPQKK